MIEATLERFGGHRAKTAEALGIGMRTLSGKLRRTAMLRGRKSIGGDGMKGGSSELASDRPINRKVRQILPQATRRNCRKVHRNKRKAAINGRGPNRSRGTRLAQIPRNQVISMFNGLFQSSTIPVLQEVVNFSQARQSVLAGNIANIDTPGYKARDFSVEDFQDRLKQAIEDRDAPALRSPGENDCAAKPLIADVAKSSQTILRHEWATWTWNRRSRKWSKIKSSTIRPSRSSPTSFISCRLRSAKRCKRLASGGETARA